MPRSGSSVLFPCIGLAVASGHGRWMMDNFPPPSLQAVEGGDFPAARFVMQPQDHFDTANSNSWQQAYFVNDTFWSPSSDAPIFLCVGGEGPALDGSAVARSEHCNVAVEQLGEKKALMFALEHRYYGCHNMSACPVRDFNQTDALKHLSSHQAIEDIANFVRQMNKLYGLRSTNKWVTFGGSYPGMLAGWSRLRHPELIHAAVASSAPVHAKLDMFEYNDAVAHAYSVSDNGVGGSPQCQKAIREGHRQLEEMLKTSKGTEAAEKILDLDQGALATKPQQQALLGEGAAYFPAQGNDPACTEAACNIGKICDIMLNASKSNEVHRLAALRAAQQASRPLRATTGWPDFWFYQTCTEFGFYQTCSEGSQCMFVQNIDVEYMAADCDAKYGIKIDDIAKNIEATNKHYGGLAPVSPSGQLGSCVVWPNGEVDPWATLSVLKSPGPEQPVIWVEGASHHAWTHPSAPLDQASVIEARGEITQQVEKFLGQDCTESKLHQIVV